MAQGGMRKQYTAEDRARLIAEVRATGEPVKTVAERLGISVSSAYLWMKKAPASAPRFAKLVRVQPAGAAEFAVQVGAATIRVGAGFDAELLRSVVSALDSGSR
jgi:transposase-like protein